MEDSATPPQNTNTPKPLNTGQKITVWAGIIGAIVGCSAWMLVMAGLGGDWTAFTITFVLDIILALIFSRLSLRHPRKRFHLLAALIVLLTAHCITVYWLRFDIWRAGAAVSHAELVKEKEIVTFTIIAMMGIILSQFLLFYWLQQHSRKNRLRMRRKP